MARPGPLRNKAPEIVTIVDLSHEGCGVARVEGKAIFVDDALPGEQVEIQRVRRLRSYDEARLLRVIEASPHRVTPRCEHYGMCGGCALQHMSDEQQILIKQKQLLEELARIGHVTPDEVLPPLRAGSWNYRRRARLGARWVFKKEKALVGFRERNSGFIAELKQCIVLRPPLDTLIQPLSDLISTLSVRAKLAQIEAAVADNTTALVFRILQDITDEDRAALLAFAQQHHVDIYLQPGGYETIVPLLPSAQPLFYRLPQFDVELQFAPSDFIQINGELNERMTALAVELLQLEPTHRVLDLFCGLGNFSLPIARHVGYVLGLEADGGLIDRARANAGRNGLSNAEFIVANLMDEKLDAPWTKEKFDRVLIDPPRAGAREILPVIASCGASRVVYVSCHPGSLARDAGILVNDYGFRLLQAGIMDMFPQTAHVESIAVFERKSKKRG
jgi:23S rRNA (uracil1939-C5)-methyltransferase